MRLTVLSLLILLAILVRAPKVQGAVRCNQVYTSQRAIVGTEVGFTQVAIGKRWAEEHKLPSYEAAFSKALSVNRKLTVKRFIQNILNEKPIRGIIDIKGTIRLIDNHHKFYALTRLYGKEIDFEISVQIIKDYSLGLVDGLGVRIWTPERKVEDMVENGFISSQGSRTPNMQWFNTLPRNILEMGDSPLRSLISFVMLSFPFQLKGSYFEPHIQNHLAQKMMELGIDPFTKNSFSQKNIDRLRDEILRRPELTQFLLEQALPDGNKYEDIVNLMTEAIEKNR